MARYNFIPETNDPEHLFTDIAQIGIVVRDLDKIMDQMQILFGAEKPPVVHAKPCNGFYRGKPAEYTADIAYYEQFNGVELEFIQPLTGQIRVDVTYLKRVLDNLFDNLRKYAEPQKPVVLSLFAEERWLHLSIENEIAQKPSGVESNKIGLRTCERIMQQMGGNFLKFQSGTHFTAELMLPLSVPEAESEAQNMPDGESKH